MLKVLLADDDELLRFVMRTAFERYGHSVTEADHGDTCLRFLTGAAFDLVCMDAQMPGASLQQRIHCAHTATPRPPRLVILTGRIDPAVQPLLQHDDRILQKPITLAAIDQMLAPSARPSR